MAAKRHKRLAQLQVEVGRKIGMGRHDAAVHDHDANSLASIAEGVGLGYMHGLVRPLQPGKIRRIGPRTRACRRRGSVDSAFQRQCYVGSNRLHLKYSCGFLRKPWIVRADNRHADGGNPVGDNSPSHGDGGVEAFG